MSFFGFLLLAIVVIALIIIGCRTLASVYPIVGTIASIAVFAIPVVLWFIYDSFWISLLSFFGAGIVAYILFGDDEHSGSRSRKIRCPKCGSSNLGRIEDADSSRLIGYGCLNCNHQWRR